MAVKHNDAGLLDHIIVDTLLITRTVRFHYGHDAAAICREFERFVKADLVHHFAVYSVGTVRITIRFEAPHADQTRFFRCGAVWILLIPWQIVMDAAALYDCQKAVVQREMDRKISVKHD